MSATFGNINDIRLPLFGAISHYARDFNAWCKEYARDDARYIQISHSYDLSGRLFDGVILMDEINFSRLEEILYIEGQHRLKKNKP